MLHTISYYIKKIGRYKPYRLYFETFLNMWSEVCRLLVHTVSQAKRPKGTKSYLRNEQLLVKSVLGVLEPHFQYSI
jgi:hypothetical protein